MGGKKVEFLIFVLFGVMGDLVKRKIFFVFYNLFIDKKFFDVIFIIGLGYE